MTLRYSFDHTDCCRNRNGVLSDPFARQASTPLHVSLQEPRDFYMATEGDDNKGHEAPVATNTQQNTTNSSSSSDNNFGRQHTTKRTNRHIRAGSISSTTSNSNKIGKSKRVLRKRKEYDNSIRGPGRPPGSLNRSTLARIKAEEEAIEAFKKSNPDIPTYSIEQLGFKGTSDVADSNNNVITKNKTSSLMNTPPKNIVSNSSEFFEPRGQINNNLVPLNDGLYQQIQQIPSYGNDPIYRPAMGSISHPQFYYTHQQQLQQQLQMQMQQPMNSMQQGQPIPQQIHMPLQPILHPQYNNLINYNANTILNPQIPPYQSAPIIQYSTPPSNTTKPYGLYNSLLMSKGSSRSETVEADYNSKVEPINVNQDTNSSNVENNTKLYSVQNNQNESSRGSIASPAISNDQNRPTIHNLQSTVGTVPINSTIGHRYSQIVSAQPFQGSNSNNTNEMIEPVGYRQMSTFYAPYIQFRQPFVAPNSMPTDNQYQSHPTNFFPQQYPPQQMYQQSISQPSFYLNQPIVPMYNPALQPNSQYEQTYSASVLRQQQPAVVMQQGQTSSSYYQPPVQTDSRNQDDTVPSLVQNSEK